MLNGPWGIGKTFLLKSFLAPSSGEDKRYVYISLYGLASFDDIDDALFRAMYPALDNKGVQLAGRALKAAGKFFQIEPDVKLSDILSKSKADLFVFDDLERCELPINKVLGYINEFVEHHDCKVIIVANEIEIRKQKRYVRVREKLIGKTLEIQSAFEEALTAFTALITDKSTRDFFEAKAAEISHVYHQAGLNNLRILQQTMWDFERFYTALDNKHQQNEQAMAALLKMLFALSFEIKAGNIKAADLNGRKYAILGSAINSRRESSQVPPIVIAQEKYGGVDLDDSTLSDDTLVDLLVKGIVDKEQIRSELDVSSYFITVADEPEWRTVWYAFDRTSEEFEHAFAEMERKFIARSYILTGEIQHVFGIRLWLSDIGVLIKSRADVVAEGKAYVDDLYAFGKIEPSSEGDDYPDVRAGGYGGLVIHEHATPEYQELYTYLHANRRRAGADRYPDLASKLLVEMQQDPDLFFRRLNVTNSEDNTFYRIPILAALNPDEFVAALLGLHPSSQRTILLALNVRYEHGQLDRDLPSERPWIETVRAKLVEVSASATPIVRYRLTHLIGRNLDPVLAPVG
jgi:hypothetical protein